jgi:alkylhydroperoxidase/carboxymuconolactone decarboxylase family protein YurZ
VFTRILVPPLLREVLTRVLMRGDYFMLSLIYGPVNAFFGILGAAQTSFVMISALVAIDSPLQIGWHEKGAVRNGASDEDMQAVKKIAELCVERIKGNCTAV